MINVNVMVEPYQKDIEIKSKKDVRHVLHDDAKGAGVQWRED